MIDPYLNTMLPFSTIICTYRRPDSILRLLRSIQNQEVLPHEILVVDGSEDDQTQIAVSELKLPGTKYIKVKAEDRGLTKQRNIGVHHVAEQSELIFFLDDDLLLEPGFFKALVACFDDSELIGAEACIINENRWEKWSSHSRPPGYHYLDGYRLKLAGRDKVRAFFGLYPFQIQPGRIPLYGHGKSSLPPDGKTRQVDHLMGGITAYRRRIFQQISFSTYFQGYGLYEDFDFSVRASRFGKLVSCTAARCRHLHDASGRPDSFQYGKMVIRNGYRVWRLKYPNPSLKSRFQWHAISWLLTTVRLYNALAGPERPKAWGDFRGRMSGLVSLYFSK